MASQPSGSKPKKGIRSFLKETLHVRSRSKSPSQPSGQQPSNGDPGLPTGVATTANTPNLKQPVEAGGSGHAAATDISDIPRPVSPPNAAWARLGVALKSLKDAAKSIPTFVLTIEVLLTCLDGLERYAKGWSDYEGSATNLAVTINSLEQSMRELDSGLKTNAVSAIVLSLQRHVSNLQGQLDHWARRDTSLAAHGRTNVADVEASYKVIQKSFGQLEANLNVGLPVATEEDIIEILLERLNPAKHSKHHSGETTDIWRTCAEGTRTELMKQLDDWTQDPETTPVCWISGTQGVGKTTIARTFCERIEERKLLAACFFCTRPSAECSDPTRIVPTIAYQLSEYSVPFRRALHEALTEYSEVDSDDGLQQFERLIQQPLAKAKDAMPSSMVVVVDGLDECGGQEGQKLILGILDRYAKEVPLRFLVTNRRKPEPDAAMGGHDQVYTTIHLDDVQRPLVRHDLERYFQAELNSLTPTVAQLEKLVDRTDMLFICAAILVRFIMLDSPRSSPQGRLELILSMTMGSTKKHAYIDALYAIILRSVLEEDTREDQRMHMRMVLWTVLFAQESIGVDTIATLAGIDDLQAVRSALRPLQPVLHHSEESGLVVPLHASFPEFMLNHERSGAFFYDIAQHSRLMAERCFGAMETGLQFNICDLESSFIPDRDVKGLEARIKEKISATLAYACRHWATHLELAATCNRLKSALKEFLSHRLLFWMEVLNLRGEITTGVKGLMKTSQWLKATDTLPSEIALLVQDACDFVTRFAAHPIRDCTPHIYLSALPFCPPSSQVYKWYWTNTTGLLQLHGNMMEYRQTAALAVWQTGPTLSIHYSPDGNLLAFRYQDGSIGIIDAHDGSQMVGPSKSAIEDVRCITFSPGGSKFAAGSEHGIIQVWSLTDWEPLIGPLQGHTDVVTSIAFSPDGTLIASSSADTTVRIWRVKDGTLAIGPLEGHANWKTPVAFSPDGTHVASAAAGHAVRVWDLREDIPTYTDFTGHELYVVSLAFTPDGSRLVSSSRDQTVRVWSTPDDAHNATPSITHSCQDTAVTISPNGEYVATSDENCSIRVWDIVNGTTVAGPFFGHKRGVEGIAFSPDGTRIACNCYDMTVRIWGAYTGVVSAAELDQSPIQATSIMFTPADSRMFATSPQGVGVWDVDHEPFPSIIISREPHPPCSLPISPDGASVAVLLDDHSVEVLSTEDGKLIAGSFRGHTDSITSAAFSSDGIYLATGSKDCTVRVWGTDGRGLIAGPLVGHPTEVVMVSLSSDGSRVVSCSSDNSIRVWNILDHIIKAEVPPEHQSQDDAGKVFDGWTMGQDGWVANHESSLLFWIPLDFAAPPSPHTELSVHYQRGSCIVPRQKLVVGPNWKDCYVSE